MTETPKPRLYVVATSHLDTQWRWTIQTTIRHFLRRTLQDNFKRFEEFPHYVLSFEGAFRYRLIEEYYPHEFLKLQAYVRRRRWHPAGAMLDAPDTILPAPESLIRHVLYGNAYFERQFGRRSADLFLPDCFGFPWSLPTIAAHCGLVGFSSQKLIKWIGPSVLPFDLGLWEGPDGSRLVTALNPGGYGETLREDLSRSATWGRRLGALARENGLALGYKYFGVGDRGGAPDPTTLDWLERSLERAGDIDVVHAGSDQIFHDLAPEDRDRLPVYRGELLLPTHGTGCWTSQAVLKKWNRNCEVLAGAAETAALAADWLGAQSYPREEIGGEWARFLWHQMHDDLTGTSSPEAYRFSWNDLALAQNRLSSLLESSVRAVCRGLDTATEGIPLMVFNSLGREREDLVDAWVDLDAESPAAVRVFGPAGDEVPSQVLNRAGSRVRVLFSARVPSAGFAVYEVRGAATAPEPSSELTVETGGLENSRYRVEVARSGAIERLYDKRLGRELLAGSMDLVLLPDRSSRWPAWELRYEDLCAEETSLPGPAEIRAAEVGPVRVTLEITRKAGRSTLRQRLSLASGEPGDRFEITNDIDWESPGSLLKARFPFAIDEPTATYDMGLGAIERGVNRPEQHEVPGHEWADLSGEGWGVSVLSRDRYGWDRPEAGVLRLSLLRSPKALRRFAHQAVQDYGRHRTAYAVSGHADRPGALTAALASGFNRPLLSFQAGRHRGPLGREFSLLTLGSDGAELMALKKAETTQDWLVRIREIGGRDSGPVRLSAAAPLAGASEVDGCERAARPLAIEGGGLVVDLPRHAPRSYLLSPQAPSAPLPALESAPVGLDFDVVGTSLHGFAGADLDGRGRSIPGELFPTRVRSGGLTFELGPVHPGAPNATACRGQQLSLPDGVFDRLHILATSTASGGTCGSFVWRVGPECGAHEIRVPYYSGFVGQWKTFSSRLAFIFKRWKPGYLERTPVAWVASHRHDRKVRDEVYTYCYLFLFELPIPPGAREIALPDEPSIKIFSAMASNAGRYPLRAAADLYE